MNITSIKEETNKLNCSVDIEEEVFNASLLPAWEVPLQDLVSKYEASLSLLDMQTKRQQEEFVQAQTAHNAEFDVLEQDAVNATNKANEAANKATAALAQLPILDGNVLKGNVTDTLVNVHDVYPSQPLGLKVEGKTIKDKSCITTVDSAEIETVGKNLCRETAKKVSETIYTWYEDSGIELPAGTFTFSTDYPAQRNLSLYAMYFGTYQNITENTWGYKSITFTLEKPTKVWFRIYNSNVFEDNITFKPQLEVGNTATPYTPYVPSQKVPIDLKGNKLCSLKDGLHDEITIDKDGNVKLIKRTHIEDDVYNRLRAVYPNDDEVVGGFLGLPVKYPFETQEVLNPYSPVDNMICNSIPTAYYAFVDYPSVYQSFRVIYFCNTKLNTVGEMLAWIKEKQPVCIVATLPREIDLGKVSLPLLPETTSNVWCNSNMPAVNVGVEYIKDVNIAYQELQQAIIASKANI